MPERGERYIDELIRKQFDEIRAEYAGLLREILTTSKSIPDWVINPAMGCACGDKCSTGTTDMDRISERVLPAQIVQRGS
jgi:hypothetical protein